MGDRIDKYLTDWSKKRDAWLASGRKDKSFLLRGEDLRAFREFVISEPRRVTSDDRSFLLACDQRADTSALLRANDIDAILLEETDVSVVPLPPTALPIPSQAAPLVGAVSADEPNAKKRRGAGNRFTLILLGLNVVLVLSMLAVGWVVKGLLVQLRETKGELQKTEAVLIKQTEEVGQVHDDLTQKSKDKAALEKSLPEVQARHEDASKTLDTLIENRRSAEEQLKAVESALAVAQEEFSKQRGRKPKGKLKVEYDRLLVKRLLLMLPPRCPKDLAQCNDEAIKESARKLIPSGSLREILSPLPHVVIYPRSAANPTKLLPLRDGQLRKLLKLPGDKSDLLLVFCPRLSEEKSEKGEARYGALLGFLQKNLKLTQERILRINQASLLFSGGPKNLLPADRPKGGETDPAEAIWVVRAPGPRPIAVSVADPS